MNSTSELMLPAAKRAKVDLACDTCRQRKSRCDGKQPVCSHCAEANRACTYRKPAEVQDNVLDRISELENRVRQLEGSLQLSATDQATPISWPKTKDAIRLPSAPMLHTAAGHKMLRYWPRLQVRLTLTEVDSLSYLRNADKADDNLMETDYEIPEVIDAGFMIHQLHHFYESPGLPAPISYLIELSECFHKTSIIDRIQAISGSDHMIQPKALPVECLLVFTLAFASSEQEDYATPQEHTVSNPGAFFRLALEFMWRIYSMNDDVQIPLLLMMAYIHVYLFSRPFHAQGLLRHVRNLIQLAKLRTDAPQIQIWSELHFMLESDLLTELDGLDMDQQAQSAPDETYASSPKSSSGTYSIPNIGELGSTRGYFQNHLWLRICLNNILHKLYLTAKAYVHPSDIGKVISRTSRELEEWYTNLPLDMQFARDATSLTLTIAAMYPKLVELSLRYLECVFMLNRPVLYFVLHEDIEHSATPPESMQIHQEIQPWMLDASRRCIRSAILLLIIIASNHSSTRLRSWCNNQLIMAAYLTILQVKLKNKVLGAENLLVDAESLLDGAEYSIENIKPSSVANRTTLAILRNVRYNISLQQEHELISPAT